MRPNASPQKREGADARCSRADSYVQICQGIATRERPALFVEQREHLKLLFVASLCDLPSLRYSLLEVTHSFQNAQCVPTCILVSIPLHKRLLSIMTR